MSKTFPQETSEAFFEFQKVCITQNKKKLHQCVLTECFEKHSKKDMVLFGFSKKKLFGTPTSCE